MLPIVATLLANGLSLIGNAVMAKGKEVVEEKLGVKIDDLAQTDEGKARLMQLQNEHESDLMAYAVEMREIELKQNELAYKNSSDVNRTMQVESTAEHWPTYSWRPAIGFSVALAVLLSVLAIFVAYGAAAVSGNTKILEYLPGALMAITGIIGVVSPILGIASWFRGKGQADPSIPATQQIPWGQK